MNQAVRLSLLKSSGAEAKNVESEIEPRLGKSAQLFSEIMTRTPSTRKKRSLTNVWNALEHLRALKSYDFTAASVGRTIQALKLSGPKDSSIRNAEGQDFREIIRAYADEYGDTKTDKSDYSDSDHMLSAIRDLRTVAYVRELIANNFSKDRRIDLLKNLIAKLTPVEVSSDGSVVSAPVKALPEARCAHCLSPIEVAAVAGFLKFIRDSGEDLELQFEPSSGALLWKEGVMEVAGPGFLQVLSKIAHGEG